MPNRVHLIVSVVGTALSVMRNLLLCNCAVI